MRAHSPDGAGSGGGYGADDAGDDGDVDSDCDLLSLAARADSDFDDGSSDEIINASDRQRIPNNARLLKRSRYFQRESFDVGELRSGEGTDPGKGRKGSKAGAVDLSASAGSGHAVVQLVRNYDRPPSVRRKHSLQIPVHPQQRSSSNSDLAKQQHPPQRHHHGQVRASRSPASPARAPEQDKGRREHRGGVISRLRASTVRGRRNRNRSPGNDALHEELQLAASRRASSNNSTSSKKANSGGNQRRGRSRERKRESASDAGGRGASASARGRQSAGVSHASNRRPSIIASFTRRITRRSSRGTASQDKALVLKQWVSILQHVVCLMPVMQAWCCEQR